jgi:hypothetical protein
VLKSTDTTGGEVGVMVYRDKTFCSESFRCGSTDCQWWVDFEVDTDGEALSLSKHRKPDCGWTEVEDEQNY